MVLHITLSLDTRDAVALVVVLVYFVFAPSYAPASKTKLSEKEVDQLVDEWEPEPLYHEIDQRTKDRLDRAPVIEYAPHPPPPFPPLRFWLFGHLHIFLIKGGVLFLGSGLFGCGM